MLTQEQPKTDAKVVRLAIIGAGTVGGGVLQLLSQERERIATKLGIKIEISHIVKRDITATQHIPAEYHGVLTDDWESCVVDEKTDIIVELIGGTDIAQQCVRRAIQAGKAVVTANKALLAETTGSDKDIIAYANKEGVPFLYEAAVAGCIPVVKILNESLLGDNIQEIYGVVNGTCNYILTLMEKENCSFSHALANAQRLGYAESDPAFDIDGIDSAHKLSLSARLGFACAVQMADIPITGIRDFQHNDITYATHENMRVKLLATAKRLSDESQIELRVCPTMIPTDHLLAAVNTSTNAVVIRSQYAGETMYYGAGAGAHPTAVAVMADIIDICCDGTKAINANGTNNIQPKQVVDNFIAPFYLRLQVLDQPGVLADIAQCLAREKVSIEKLRQYQTSEEGKVDIVLILHAARHHALAKSISEIKNLPCVCAAPVVLPIERFS